LGEPDRRDGEGRKQGDTDQAEEIGV